MNKLFIIGAAFIVVCLTSCDDDSVSPPKNTKWLTVSIKIPSETVSTPIHAVYRSSTCLRKNFNSNMDSYKIDGYNYVDIHPLKVNETNIYEGKVAISGGGKCQWSLSNVTFGFQYEEKNSYNTHLIEPAIITLVLDKYIPQQSDGFERVIGDFVIKNEYYPLINNVFLGGKERTLSLFSHKKNYVYLLKDTERVDFIPDLHSDKPVFVMGPEKNGDKVKVEYPDGKVVVLPKGQVDPDINKLHY